MNNNTDTIINDSTKQKWAIYIGKMLNFGDLYCYKDSNLIEKGLLYQYEQAEEEEVKAFFNQAQNIEEIVLKRENFYKKMKREIEDLVLLANELQVYKINAKDN